CPKSEQAMMGAVDGRGPGPGRWCHLVPRASGEAGEGAPGGARDYRNGLESEELEPEELLLDPKPEPKPKEEPPQPDTLTPAGALGPGPGSGAPGSQDEEEPGLVEGDPGYGAIEDRELETIKTRVREMEEEAEKLKELQNEVEKQMNMSPPLGNAEKMEADARFIYVGNVDYGATAEKLEAHFHGCDSVNRVTILCDKFSGHPKGFAYTEFSDKESVRTSLVSDESLFRGRQIKVIPKRTNRPGISTTDRGFPRARYRAQTTNYNSYLSRFYSGFNSRPQGRIYRGVRDHPG
uniref:Polyadenylate-binding protein 2 n=1 Tax=Rhinopithecus bieti TaxID=61621 RepID=A0A2K6M6M3_RHIBE